MSQHSKGQLEWLESLIDIGWRLVRQAVIRISEAIGYALYWLATLPKRFPRRAEISDSATAEPGRSAVPHYSEVISNGQATR